MDNLDDATAPSPAAGSGGVVGDERLSRALLPGAPRWVVRGLFTSLAVLVALPLLRNALMGLQDLAVTVLAAVFVSFALEPVVDLLSRKGLRRGAAAALTMSAVLIVTTVFVVLVGATLMSQGRALLESFPGMFERLQGWLAAKGVKVDLSTWSDKVTSLLGERAVGAIGPLVAAVVQVATVAFFAFYLAVDGPRLRRSLGSLLRPRRQAQLVRVWELAVDRTGRFILSRALLALLSAATHTVVFALLGVDSAVVLGMWVGVISQLIPVLGTYLAGAVPVLVAFSAGPSLGVAVFFLVVLYQQVENYLVAPRIQASMLDIHPAVGLASVLAGASVLGTVGALLALPATATVQAFVSTYLHRYELIDELSEGPSAGLPASSPVDPPTGAEAGS